MKKYILLFAMSLMAAGVMAQNHELRVGYGVASTNRLLNTENGLFGISWNDQFSNVKSVNTSAGAISFGYRYKISRIRLGLSGAYEKVNGEYTLSDNSVREGQHKYWTVAADLQFSYIKFPKGIVELYWGASAGVGMVSQNVDEAQDEQKRSRFAYQVVPLGISVGAPWIGIYAEAGFGYRGVVNLGAYVRF